MDDCCILEIFNILDYIWVDIFEIKTNLYFYNSLFNTI
jgi:hypothetical protein